MKMNSENPIGRRRAIQWLAAGTAAGVVGGVATTGCANQDSNRRAHSSSARKPHREFELYVVKLTKPHELPWEDIQKRNLPQPIFVGSRESLLRQQDDENVAYVIWARKEQAESFAKLEGIESVSPKLATDTVVEGAAGDGDLFVSLLVNDNTTHIAAEGTFQTDTEVLAYLKEVAGAKVDIESVPTTEPVGADFQEIVDGGQIRVKCPDGCPEALLEAIMNHPQIIKVRWGGPFTSTYCPPCGMG